MPSEEVWETFNELFKTAHRQGRRIEELEARLAELERRLAERPNVLAFPASEERETVEV